MVAHARLPILFLKIITKAGVKLYYKRKLLDVSVATHILHDLCACTTHTHTPLSQSNTSYNKSLYLIASRISMACTIVTVSVL